MIPYPTYPVPDWVAEQNALAALALFEEYSNKIAAKRKEMRKAMEIVSSARRRAGMVSSPSKRTSSEATDDDDNKHLISFSTDLVDRLIAELADEAAEDPTLPTPPRVLIYASRTHSQLEQFIGELTRTPWAPHTAVVTLGSRRHCCLHEAVRHTADIEDACRDLGTSCPYRSAGAIARGRDALLSEPSGLTDAAAACREHNACPYFSARAALPHAGIVCLPYPTLFNTRTRDALGVVLTANTAIIVDEGHNVPGAIQGSHDIAITLTGAKAAFNGLQAYLRHYIKRLGKETKKALGEAMKLLVGITKTVAETAGTTQELSTFDFMANVTTKGGLGAGWAADGLLRFMTESSAARKMDGFLQSVYVKAARSPTAVTPSVASLFDLVSLLTVYTRTPDEFKVLVTPPDSTDSGTTLDAGIRVILLDCRPAVTPLVSSAASLALLGGTLSPIDQLAAQLIPQEEAGRIARLSLSHVVDPSHLYVRFISSYAGNELTMTQATKARAYPSAAAFLASTVPTVPGGSVVFVPSYADLTRLAGAFDRLSGIPAFSKVTQVWEHVAGADSFARFKSAVDHSGSAVLFAVSSGRVSEGINFSDQYGRAVFIVGIPYPNVGDPIFQLRRRHAGSGDYMAALAFRAVNQCVGRAIRHAKDYAAMVFVDGRYGSASVQARLPGWITRGGVGRWGERAEMEQFYRGMDNGG